MRLAKKEIFNWRNNWQKEGHEALSSAEDLFKSKHYHHALFFGHLALEKIIKAGYLLRRGDFPPPVHDLLYLLRKSKLNLSKEELRCLAEINTFNVRARYDDYKRRFYKKATKKYTKRWLKILKDLFKNIEKNL